MKLIRRQSNWCSRRHRRLAKARTTGINEKRPLGAFSRFIFMIIETY